MRALIAGDLDGHPQLVVAENPVSTIAAVRSTIVASWSTYTGGSARVSVTSSWSPTTSSPRTSPDDWIGIDIARPTVRVVPVCPTAVRVSGRWVRPHRATARRAMILSERYDDDIGLSNDPPQGSGVTMTCATEPAVAVHTGLGNKMSTRSGEDPAASMEEIDREECLMLVGSLSVGRLAVSLTGEPPLVVPINFMLDGEVVVFRSDPGTKLQALSERPGGERIGRHPNASFQVDLIDPVHRTGWSVLIRGVAYAAEVDEVAHLDLESWAPGHKDHLVRLVPTSITGRRIRTPELPWDTRGYL